MTRRGAFVAAIAVAAAGCASPARAILRANERLYHAIAAGDRATLETIITPDFHFVTADGVKGDRAAFLDGVSARGDVTVEWIDNDRLRVELHDGYATLCGRQRAVAVAGGKRVHDEGHFCDRWEQRDGVWRVSFAGP